MKLNRKLWTAALAVAMTTPSAMAAQDTAGMHYTSASEGFYASIRLRYVSNGNKKDGGANIENGSSRIGVRGTNDLGGGLEGFYQYEMGVGTDQGADNWDKGMGTRLAHVGLRGDFGSVVAGAFWPDTYNWVYGSTDVANRQSGSVTGGFGQYRTSKSLQYTTPDLNGFQGAILIKADSASDGQGDVGGINKDDNDVDHWTLAGAYDIAGFSMGASYANNPDAIAGVNRSGHEAVEAVFKSIEADARSAALKAYNALPASVRMSVDPAARQSAAVSNLDWNTGHVSSVAPVGDDGYKKDDLTSWAVKIGYSQDNWYVNSWYGEVSHGNASDFSGVISDRTTMVDVEGTPTNVTVSHPSLKFSDTEVFSIAGGITVDKVAVYAVYENREASALVKSGESVVVKAQDDSFTTLGVQYTLGSNSWTWIEYAGQDRDSKDDEDDTFSIGLGHSF